MISARRCRKHTQENDKWYVWEDTRPRAQGLQSLLRGFIEFYTQKQFIEVLLISQIWCVDHKDPEVCRSVHLPKPRMLENIITRGLKLESNQLPTQLNKLDSICTVVTTEAPEATLHLHINTQKYTKYHTNTDLLFKLLGLKGQRVSAGK